MELMLLRPDYFEAHWNCSSFNTSSIPDDVKKHPYYGIFLFVTSTIYIVLYIPCIYAMTRKELVSNACYKIMLLMAYFDIFTLPVCGLVSGYMSIHGILYCDARLLNNIIGTFLLGIWMAYSWAAVILALNRMFALTDHVYLFQGARVYYWLALPLTVGILSVAFGKPVAYSPIYGTWLFNPFMGSVVDHDEIYAVKAHTLDNLTFSVLLPIIYLVFFLKNRALIMNKSQHKVSKKEYSLFMQCVIISGCITTAAAGYTVIQFVEMPAWFSPLCHILWVSVQGSPPIVYLTMNHSIQRILLRKFPFKIMRVQDSSLYSEQDSTHHHHTVSPISKIHQSNSSF